MLAPPANLVRSERRVAPERLELGDVRVVALGEPGHR
jgi:hypothetical protein